MKKFWKIYSWIYLGVMIFGLVYYMQNSADITIELSRIKYIIAYVIAYVIAYIIIALLWSIPVVGLFLYSFNKRKFMIFWRLYFIYFIYRIAVMLIEVYKTGKFPSLLPFHAIALVGLFLYSFTHPKVKEVRYGEKITYR